MHDATITTDLTCVRCGYSLRGLPPDGRCPECGLAAHRSAAAGGRLAEAPPGWVSKVAAGAGLLAAANPGPAIGMALNALPAFQRVWWAGALLTWVFFALHAAGAFLLTAREPGAKARGAWDAVTAWALRLASLGPLIGIPLFWYFILDSRAMAPNGPLVRTLNEPAVLCPVLVMLRLAGLLRRVGRPRLAEHGAIAGCALTVAVVAVFVSGEGRHLDFAFVLAAAVAAGFCYFWCVGVLFAGSYFLRQAAREARASWDAADLSYAAKPL